MTYIPVAERNSAPQTGGPLPKVSSGYLPVAQRAAKDPTLAGTSYIPVAERVAAPTPAPVSKPGILSRIGGAIEKATARPEPGSAADQSTLGHLPSEFIEHLPGVGGIIKAARDNPEAVADLSASDFLKGAVEAGKGVVRGVAGAVANFVPVPVKFNIPGLGEVTNRQFNAADRIRNGEDPLIVTLAEGAGSIFDTLMLVGIGQKLFGARPTAIAKSEVAPDEGITVKEAPKTGRLYEEPTYTHPLTPEMIDQMKSDGVKFESEPDPNLPTYFKMTGKANGKIVGEIVQMKPSLFKTFVSKFGGDISKVPDTQLTVISTKETSVKSFDEAKSAPIENKYVPVNERTASPEPAAAPDTGVIEGFVQEVQDKALTDWEDNFADKAAERGAEITKLQSEVKQVKASEKASLQKELSALLAEHAKIEDAFVDKWKQINEARKEVLSGEAFQVPKSPLSKASKVVGHQPIKEANDIKIKVPTVKTAYNKNNIMVGEHAGKPYTTDGVIFELADLGLTKTLATVPEEKVIQEVLEKARAEKTELVPHEIISSEQGHMGHQVALKAGKNEVLLDSKYYNYLANKYKNLVFKGSATVVKSPVAIYDGKIFKGMVMPMQYKLSGSKVQTAKLGQEKAKPSPVKKEETRPKISEKEFQKQENLKQKTQAQITPTGKVLSPEKYATLEAEMKKTGGFLTEKDVSRLAQEYGNVAITVKDVNGHRGYMSINDFQTLSKNKGFSDRIRAVFISSAVKNLDIKPEFQEGFMTALQPAKLLEGGEEEQPRGELAKIEGITFSNTSSISASQISKFIEMTQNETVRGALKDNGIKEINIQPPYKFQLSEQAHLVRGKKIININADATNPTQTILHELGHAKFEDLPKGQQDRLIERAKNTTDPEMVGYKYLKEWEEIIADSLYNKPEFARGLEVLQIKTPDVSKIKPKEEPTPRETSITLRSELIPGATDFITKDVLPKSRSLLEGTRNVYRELATLFNPVGRAPTEGVDIIMRHKGGFERDIFRLEQTMKNIKKMWDKQPEEARLDFMAKVENGEAVPAEYKELAEMYRLRLDNAYKAVEKFKDVPFLENFFPHFWEKPGQINLETIAKSAKRPFQGSRSFLKERVFQTIQEGIKAGYKPVSTNPEELVQIYEANVGKFIMAQEIKADMIEKGFWKFVKEGAQAPDDFARIDDTIARIYFPAKTEAGGTVVTKSGEYWAQKDVGRLINNYLSKDFIYDTALGRGIMQVKNTLNAFQLGFSAFHLTMETLDTIVTKMSIGFSKLAGGNIAGLTDVLTSPLAPASYFRAGQKFYNGDPELLKIENDLFTGGASLRERQYYKNSVFDNFFKAVREGNYLGAFARLPLATIEGLMRPLFSYYIPRLKVGAFRDLFAAELERQSEAIATGKISREKIARDVWNNIENRMGELNYDNLFWHKNLKTGLMLTFRAVGWNLGTVRELGGGIFQDMPKQGFNLLTGKGAEFTPKMSYTLSIFTFIAALSALYQYAHTGKKPESVKDLYYPRNGATDKSGEAYRVEFPSYLKDLYQFSHRPIHTIGNKLAPEFTTIIDLLTNKDFFGDYIRNENDNLSTQSKQLALYLATQFEPFTIQQTIQLQKGKSTPEQQIEAFFGIIKAPREVIQSEYQKQIAELFREQAGEQGPRTPEQKEIAQKKAEVRTEIQNGDYSGLNELVAQKIITPRGRATFIRNARLTSDQRMLKSLNKDNKAKVRALLQPETP